MSNYSEWTLDEFAAHYAETMAKPANGWGQHVSPIFGQSHFIMIAASNRFPPEEVERAFAEVMKPKEVEPMGNRTIELAPSWTDAARIFCAALEYGTGEGKQMAREEVVAMGRKLDELRAHFDKLDSELAESGVIPAREGNRIYEEQMSMDELTSDADLTLRNVPGGWQFQKPVGPVFADTLTANKARRAMKGKLPAREAPSFLFQPYDVEAGEADAVGDQFVAHDGSKQRLFEVVALTEAGIKAKPIPAREAHTTDSREDTGTDTD